MSSSLRNVSRAHVRASKKFPALLFHDLTYSVNVNSGCFPGRKSKKKILEEVSGQVHYGELVALMGASGSGKTTLLDLLALRTTDTSQLQGTLLHGGVQKKTLTTSESAYVMQADVALRNLTVRETLMYAAQLRLPKHEVQFAQEKIDSLIEELGLTSCADTRVGDDQYRGISGGQLRRLSIAQELINDPNFLFLDEPTSGLDSTTAFNLIQLLRKLALTRSQAILCSIHQPSPQIFAQFERVMLLSLSPEGVGRVAYFGCTGDMQTYLTAHGYPPPEHFSIADHALELANNFIPGLSTANDISEIEQDLEQFLPGEERQVASVDLSSLWRDSSEARQLDETVKSSMPTFTEDEDDEPPVPADFRTQLSVYTRRSFVDMVRAPGFWFTRILKLHVVGLIVSTAYFQLDYSPENVQNRVSLVFFLLLSTFLYAQSYLPVLMVVRPLTTRERGSNLYGASTQFFGTLISSLPLDILNSLIFPSYVYWITNLNNSIQSFFSFLLLYITFELAMIAFNLCISAMVQTGEEAATLSPLGFLPLMMLCGFFVIDLPTFYAALSYVDPLRYALYAVLFNEFHDVEFDCTICEPGDELCVSDCTYPDGNALLDFYDVDIHDYGGFYLYTTLVALFAFSFYVILYLLLRFVKFERR